MDIPFHTVLNVCRSNIAAALLLPVLTAVAFLGFPEFVCGEEDAAEPPAAKALFDGKTMDGWKRTNFGGEGEIEIKEGVIHMDFGSNLTGITYAKDDFPKSNYEVSLKAMQVDGIDFFCGMTFPVKDSHCSFIVAGWGGSVVGLSNIDGKDASSNDTTKHMKFEQKKWYDIRVRVTDKNISAWIDGKQVVDQNTEGKKIGIRPEVELSRPFGICAWETRAALKDIKLTVLQAD